MFDDLGDVVLEFDWPDVRTQWVSLQRLVVLFQQAANYLMSAHLFNYVEDEVSIAEAIRLFDSKTGTKNRLARWENIYRMWKEGKSLIDIGLWIGKSESTVRQLLKRAALERQKQPGFVWPVKDGKKVCDIPHPMPHGEDPREWHHVKVIAVSPTSRTFFCPVCKKGYPMGLPLKSVLADDDQQYTFTCKDAYDAFIREKYGSAD